MNINRYEAMDFAVDAAKKWLDGLDDRPVAATGDLQTLRQRISLRLEQRSKPAYEVVNHLLESTKGGLLGSASGRFKEFFLQRKIPAFVATDIYCC